MNNCNCKQCKDEVIYLMSSGYEWECPHCSGCNNLSSIPKENTVQCEECHTEYPLMGEDHAFD